MRVKICSALAALALSSAPALADAAWSSNLGPVVYDVDAGDYVVLMHFTPGSGAVRRTFVQGLVGNLGHRGSYTGYWIEADDGSSTTPACDITILDAEGNATRHWGRVQFQVTNSTRPRPAGARAIMAISITRPSTAAAMVRQNNQIRDVRPARHRNEKGDIPQCAIRFA